MSDIQDRERMTEKALSAIRKTGTAPTIGICRVLVDQIHAELSEREPEHFVDASSMAELQVFLERAAAVLKKV